MLTQDINRQDTSLGHGAITKFPMDNFHTVIVGAGPAGLNCAAVLARQGYKVVVLERNQIIGPKVCAGGIPCHALQDLKLPAELIEKSFPEQHIHTPWQKAVVKSATPIISTVNREKLGQWMAGKAQNNGAMIITGAQVRHITDSYICLKHRKIGYQYLVGADGSSSMVRRHLKIPTTKIGTGINYQLPVIRQNMEWHLNLSSFHSGYAWIFPHKQSTSVGIYAAGSDLRPGIMKERLQAWSRRHNLDLEDSQTKAALINFDYRGWNFGNTFLAGDAAGLASGFTGEGIYPAIISGQTIAQTIIDPDYAPRHLNRLIKQQQRHNRMQKFFTGNKVVCQIAMEMLVLAIKCGLLKFDILEMN